LVLALEKFFVKVNKKLTQHFSYSLKNKQYNKSTIYEHVSPRFQ